MEAVGGPQTYVLGGAFNCGKGQPGQVAPVSHGCPAVLMRGRPDPQHGAGGGHDLGSHGPPQEAVERALAAARLRRLRGDRRRDLLGQPALGRQHAHHERRLPVRAAHRDRDQPRRRRQPGPAWCPGRASRDDQMDEVVAEARAGGRGRLPGRGRAAAAGPGRRRPSGAGPGAAPAGTTRPRGTEIGVFARLRRRPRRGVRRGGRAAAGSSTASPSTTLTSHVPRHLHRACGCGTTSPPGKVELNAKSADLTRSAWAGAGHPRLHRRGRGRRSRPAWPGGWAGPSPPGRAARRAVRDAAAADRRGRPADLPVLVGRGQGRAWTAGRCSASPAAAPGSASGWPACRSRCAATRARPGLDCAPFVHRARLARGVLGVRQRPAAARPPTGSTAASWPR